MNPEDLSVKAERSQDSAEQLSPVWEDSASATQFKPGPFRTQKSSSTVRTLLGTCRPSHAAACVAFKDHKIARANDLDDAPARHGSRET